MQFKYMLLVLFALVCVQQVFAEKDCEESSKDQETCDKCCGKNGILLKRKSEFGEEDQLHCHCTQNRAQFYHIWDYLAPF